VGLFLVDVWCLGVKDAFGEHDIPDGLADELIDNRLSEEQREAVHPTCAKKLIEGASAYAERLGFAPHRDYRKGRKVLSGLDASLCPTEFTFGRNGKPCYMRGPHDDNDRADRILAILTARCGEDGYDFVDVGGELDLGDVEELRQDLIAWLDDEPEDVPRFYKFSGMVTGMQLCPKIVPPAQLLEKMWGPEGRTWDRDGEVEEFMSMLIPYWNYVAGLLRASAAPEATIADQAIDVWERDFPEKQKPIATMAAMVEWAHGFMQTTKYWPEAWGDALKRPELAEHWEMIRWWAEFIGTGNKDRIADAAEANPPRNISLSVQALVRALRPVPPA
jgi:yecA family protein